ncbi:MAG TPA: HyaD/HybD family hydrogenase maturation endopeptidase [Casimicrobiaceae bacterium]|jgi:hydrogenase maturation protease|nr:HyaD/HybD family hydrogenase maturation endopeptidase [Casimicrobiaceae bacterium]
MEPKIDALVLGIGNVLWADEGFGVRAVEALHAAWTFPDNVRLMDGGTLGLNLFEDIASARQVLVFDAIDYGLPGGTLKVLRDAEVPAWGAKKLSPHQTGFNDILALAQLRGTVPERITAIGVQPVELDDFGGSLRAPVRARLAEAVELAVRELALWGYAATPRAAGSGVPPLNAQSLALDAYEAGRPSEDDACRIGDPRVLETTRRRDGES